MGMAMRRAGPFARDVGEAIVDEVGHEGVDDAVVALSALFARSHQLEVTQKRKLVAHGRHRQAEGVGKVADAELVVSEGVHQSQAERIRQREENFDGFARGGLRWEVTAELCDFLGVGDVG